VHSRVELIGRLKDDIILSTTVTNKTVGVGYLAVAKARFQKKEVEWFYLKFFNRTAEIAHQYSKQGALVYVEGPYFTYKETKDGVQLFMPGVFVTKIILLGTRRLPESGLYGSDHKIGDEDSLISF
jgi:single-stranded DNA-binding protein